VDATSFHPSKGAFATMIDGLSAANAAGLSPEAIKAA